MSVYVRRETELPLSRSSFGPTSTCRVSPGASVAPAGKWKLSAHESATPGFGILST